MRICVFVLHVLRLRLCLFAVNTPNVLVEILLSSEPFVLAFAIWICAHELCFGAAVLAVDLSLVAEEAT